MPSGSDRSLVRRLGGRIASGFPDSWRVALFRRAARFLGVSGTDRGLVSVVVVVDPRDTERLADSLASVRDQTHGYHEVLVAPVGETTVPRSPDNRVRVLPTRPTWWEAANTATALARGRWVLWHRGCDLLAPTALADLAAADAELASGVLAQRGSAEAWLDRAQQVSHRPRRGAPAGEAAADLVLGNKLVRREHWAGHAWTADDTWLQSPTLARLLTRTTDLAVLDTVVAEHLHDHGRRAFAATPSSLPALEAWQRSAARVEDVLRGTPLEDGWHRTTLEVSLPRFLADTERASDSEWARLRALVTDARGDRDAVGVRARGLLWLAAQDRRADVEALAAEIEELGADLPCLLDGPDLYVQWRSTGAPADVRRLRPDETPLVAEVRGVRATDRGREVEVLVRVPHLDLSAATPMVSTDDDVRVEVDPDPAATRWAGERFAGNDRGRLSLLVPGDDERPVTLRLSVGALVREATVVVPPAPPAPESPDVRGLRVDDEGLLVDGDDLVLLDSLDRVVEEPVGGRFRLVTTRFGRTAPLPTGRYRLRVLRADGTTDPVTVPGIGTEALTPHHRVRVFTGPFGGLVVALAAPLADDEAGPRAQQLLRERYAGDDRPVDPGVWYFETYAGRSATDSPLAVHEELRARRAGVTTYWGIADHGQWVPDGSEPVLIGSRRHYEVLATAGTIVTNTDVEAWFRRRPGQHVVQTFHGYPSKAMGASQWRALELRPSKVREARARGVDTWSLIVTPTPEATGWYREEYGYDGPAAEHGYPRDDVLRSGDAPERRERARELLGIGNRTAVLYAPTWRDHLATRPRGAAMADFLDVDAFAEALGHTHVLLLRGHRFNAGRGDRPGVVDVTDHPEINDLVLASDVAVLDYSSLRFDVALTGTPMVFLVPDLAAYDAGTRAFIQPFRETAPGPMVTTTAEVVSQVRDAAGLRARWAGDIETMNERWNPYQDGRAAARVVQAILDLRAP